MAGDGLIWAGIGQGIAAAGSTMGQFLMKDLLAQEDREYRAGTRQEELRMRLEDRERDRELRKEIAAGRESGGGGGSAGLKAEDLAPGGKLAGMMAGNAGMTEPDYAKYVAARKTGDMSGFMREETEYGDFGEENKVSKLPKGFEEEYAAKIRTISKLEEQYALAGKFDDVAKGRQIEFGTKMGETAFAKPEVAGKAGQAVAVAGGKALQNTEGGETYNMYTGESKTTPVGKSQIAENQARAGELGALGKKYGKDIEKIDAEIAGGMFNKNSSEKLTSVVNAANGTIKSLNESSKGSTPEAKAEWQRQYDDAVAVRDKATALQKGALDVKANPPAPKPEAATEKAPSISEVQGAPSGSSIGSRTDKGWEVRDKSGKLIGYTRGKK
jgi:hypothetical protein